MPLCYPIEPEPTLCMQLSGGPPGYPHALECWVMFGPRPADGATATRPPPWISSDALNRGAPRVFDRGGAPQRARWLMGSQSKRVSQAHLAHRAPARPARLAALVRGKGSRRKNAFGYPFVKRVNAGRAATPPASRVVESFSKNEKDSTRLRRPLTPAHRTCGISGSGPSAAARLRPPWPRRPPDFGGLDALPAARGPKSGDFSGLVKLRRPPTRPFFPDASGRPPEIARHPALRCGSRAKRPTSHPSLHRSPGLAHPPRPGRASRRAKA